MLEVYRDAAVIGIAGGGQVRRVDDLDVRRSRRPLVVQLLLHAGDVRVGLLHREPSRCLEVVDVADESVDHHHLMPRDVVVLQLRDAFVRRLPMVHILHGLDQHSLCAGRVLHAPCS